MILNIVGANINVGTRSHPTDVGIKSWNVRVKASDGLESGVYFGITEKYVTLFFNNKSAAIMTSVMNGFINLSSPTFTITPDDSCGIGLTTNASNIVHYVQDSFSSHQVNNSLWDFKFTIYIK